MVELMLHHTGQIAFHNLVMLHQVLIQVLHAYLIASFHRFVNARQAQAAFFHRYFFARYFEDMRIDICLTETFIFGIIFRQHIQVYNHHTDRQTDLRRCKSHAIGMVHGFEHILNQFFQVRIIGSNVLRYFSQYGLSVYINR